MKAQGFQGKAGETRKIATSLMNEKPRQKLGEKYLINVYLIMI